MNWVPPMTRILFFSDSSEACASGALSRYCEHPILPGSWDTYFIRRANRGMRFNRSIRGPDG